MSKKPDEGKLRKQKSRGDRAKRILDDEIVREAFAQIEIDVLDSWKDSEGNAAEVRERAYLMFRLLKDLKWRFEHLVHTGDKAAKDLLQMEKEAKS